MDHEQAARTDHKIRQLEAELKRVNAERQHSHSKMDEVQFDQLKKQVETQITLENQNKDIAELKAHLLGNGKPGLLTRVDRIEQSDKARANAEKNRVWFWRAILTGIITLLGLMIIQLLIHFGLK